MRMCRSPVDDGPPSIGGSDGTGYGPGSLSSAYSNRTGTRGPSPATTTYGIPIGAPSHTVPKSGWSPVSNPMLAMRASEFGSTGAPDTSVFHGLSGGNGRLPPRLA